jgi:hypothetical protein
MVCSGDIHFNWDRPARLRLIYRLADSLVNVSKVTKVSKRTRYSIPDPVAHWFPPAGSSENVVVTDFDGDGNADLAVSVAGGVYIVNATYADITTVGIVTANSNVNKLVVRIFKVDGTTKIQPPFYLTVFKP